MCVPHNGDRNDTQRRTNVASIAAFADGIKACFGNQACSFRCVFSQGISWRNLFRGLDSWTGLVDWTG